jgi:hypothetical protein
MSVKANWHTTGTQDMFNEEEGFGNGNIWVD